MNTAFSHNKSPTLSIWLRFDMRRQHKVVDNESAACLENLFLSFNVFWGVGDLNKIAFHTSMILKYSF